MPSKGIRVAGNPAPIRVSYAIERSILEPGETRQIYRGENIAMRSAFDLLGLKANRSSFRQDGAAASAEIVSRSVELVVEVVEIDFTAATRDWWTCPAYASLTSADRFKVLSALKAIEDFSSEGHSAAEIAAFIASLEDDFPAPYAAIVEDVFLNGETYLAILPVITYTRSVSRYYPQKFVIGDIGKVFSTAAMNAQVPTDPQFDVSEVTNTIAANSKQTLGWLKSGRRLISSDGTSQYIQQYVFDAYPTARYTFIA